MIYCAEKYIANVKNIPIQSANIPSIAHTKKIISNKRIIQKCFDVVEILAFIALIASRFPKIINGIVSSTSIVIITEIINEMIGIKNNKVTSRKYKLVICSKVVIPEETRLIKNPAKKRFLK